MWCLLRGVRRFTRCFARSTHLSHNCHTLFAPFSRHTCRDRSFCKSAILVRPDKNLLGKQHRRRWRPPQGRRWSSLLLFLKRVSYKSDKSTLRFNTNSASLRDATRRHSIAKAYNSKDHGGALRVFERPRSLRLLGLRTSDDTADTRADVNRADLVVVVPDVTVNANCR